MNEITVDQVEDAKSELGLLMNKFLEQRGWKTFCQNPASLWLWQKGEFKGVSTEVAWAFERANG